MTDRFKALSLSYKAAPLDIRSLLSLDEPSTRKLLESIKELTGLSDVLILSTCNRTEIYYSSEEDKSDILLKILGLHKNIPSPLAYLKHFRIILDHDEAVLHLFRVAMGLEAQVVGDIQISNQVKTAYQYAADADIVGPFLHRLLHTIFFTNKRISQETAFRDGAASVSYATVEMVSQMTHNILDPRVLVLGVGEMGVDVCRNLQTSGFKDVFITNRTEEKATEIAEECGFATLPFDSALGVMEDFDVIISSIPKEIINAATLKDVKILSFKYFFDMAVPRSINPDVEQVPGALLFDVDGIRNQTSETLEARLAAVPQVETIIDEAIVEFNNWSREMEVSPTIQRLKNALEQIRQEEVGRHLKGLDVAESERLEAITKGMMQKIIKLPVLQLKAACKRGEAETLIDVLNDLFDLEEKMAVDK